jgi:hypothetical protein
MRRKEIPPGLAWLLVFGPAVLYLFITRLGRGSREYGQLMPPMGTGDATATAVSYYLVADYDDGRAAVNLTDAVWRHDGEMGRGYLLLSDAARYGRVWRWELGGGPISIGTTLHLDLAGCRTAQCVSSTTMTTTAARGSGALAIQFARDAASPREGRLLVAEWGEGRIVRLEDNGARTPLLLMTDTTKMAATTALSSSSLLIKEDGSNNNNSNHLEQPKCEQQTTGYPRRMVLTATGDLIVIGTYTFRQQPRTSPPPPPIKNHGGNANEEEEIQEDKSEKNQGTTASASASSSECVTIPALVQVTQAEHIPALASLEESRAAHAWRRLEDDYHSYDHGTDAATTTRTARRRILWADPSVSSIGGLAVTDSALYVAAVQDTSPVILKISLVADDDDDDDDDDEKAEAEAEATDPAATTTKSTVVAQLAHNLSRHGQHPGALVVTETGDLIVAVDATVVVCRVSKGASTTTTTTAAADGYGDVVLLQLPEVPTSLVLGDDNYLYMTSPTKLYRHFFNAKPYPLSTHLLPKPPPSPPRAKN